MVQRPPGATAAPRRTIERPATAQGQWLSIEEFCTEVGVPLSTAYKWAQAGPESSRFPRFRRLPNGRIRIRRDWLEAWLDELPTR